MKTVFWLAIINSNYFRRRSKVLYLFENIKEQDSCQFLGILFTKKSMVNSPSRFAGFVLLHLSWNTAGGADHVHIIGWAKCYSF